MPALTSLAPYATLAECQASAFGPVPVAIAVQVVIAVARTLASTPNRAPGISPYHVRIGYDGSVGLVEGDGRAVAMRAAYLSPEQAGGAAIDARADVFSLGVILWELLSGRVLFDRGNDIATATAILADPISDIRTLVSDVPSAVGDVLASALARNPRGRFDSVDTFGRALAGARAASNLVEVASGGIAAWVDACVPQRPSGVGPPPSTARGLGGADLAARHLAASAAVPELDLPGASRAARSSENTSSPPAGGPTSVRTAAAAAFADLALPPPASSRGPASLAAPPPSAPPRTSQPQVSQAPAYGIAFEPGEDDDFDMQIERNLMTSGMPAATSGRPSGVPTDRSSMSSAPRSNPGLELGAPSRLALERRRSREHATGDDVGFLGQLLGLVVALVLLGGAAFALLRFVHRAGGRPVLGLLPHAFDGTSATESGAVALVALVLSVTLLFVGLGLRPHAWWVIASGGALLLLALAMVTVTLASTGDNPTPPDGVLLVPYLAPVSLALLGLGLVGRAGRIFARSRGARKIGGLPLALIAGALVFAAFELSRLATRL